MFQKKISTIKKDSKNPHFKNTYASLVQILSEVKPILSELGIVIMQPVTENKCCTLLIDSESGERMTSDIILPTNLTPQQMGSALTYYRRYLLAGMLALEIDDDDANDTNASTNALEKAKTKLLECDSLEKLQQVYLSFSVEIRKLTLKLKDELKLKLSGDLQNQNS